MEKYYFIREDESKTGVPAVLEAGIYERFIEKEKYIKDYTFPPVENPTPAWYRPITKDKIVQMPEKLFLINKHRTINFDILHKDGGFIISDIFKKIIDANNHPQYLSSHLEVLTREGECNTKKEYWYIKFIERSPCIDFSKSDVKLVDKNSNLEQPMINKYMSKITLNSNCFNPKELFWIDNAYMNRLIFCNQKTVEDIEDAKMKTVIITEIEALFEYFHSVGWVNQKTKLVIEE